MNTIVQGVLSTLLLLLAPAAMAQSIESWGADNSGQVSQTPVNLPFTGVSGGGSHSLVLKSNGSLFSWGLDTHGQVTGTPTGVGFTQIAGGDQHSVAKNSAGSISCWGWDIQGVVTNTPAGTGFTQLASGGYHALALQPDGSIVSWGRDAEGQVTDTPVGTDFVQIAAGSAHSLALKSDGSIVSWGADYTGAVASTPPGTGFAQVSGGTGHSLALRAPAIATSYCTAGSSTNGCTATLAATGTASATAATGFILVASTVEGAKDGLFFFGTSGRQANSWGNGTSFQCVVPSVKRAGLLSGIGTIGACDGSFTQDLNARWTAKPAQNPGGGAVVQAQLWYRDPFNTSNQTTSLSNALEFTVAP